MSGSAQIQDTEYNLPKAILSTFIPCLGLFAYGFDFGATAWSLDSIEKYSDNVSGSWTNLISTNDLMEGFFTGATTFGAVIGIIWSVTRLKHLLYKTSMRAACFLLIVASTLEASSGYFCQYNTLALFSVLFGRVLYGMVIGLFTVNVPKYIGEVAPPQIRGTLSSGMEFAVVCGVCCSYALGYVSSEYGKGWELIFQIEAVPAVLMLLGLNFIPESPRLLLSVGCPIKEVHSAAKIITPNIRLEEIEQLQLQLQTEKNDTEEAIWGQVIRICSGSKSCLMSLGIAMVLLQQFAGAPTVSYYLVTILDDTYTSWSTVELMRHLIVAGGCKIIGDVFAASLIDYFGRKTLLLVGFFFSGVSCLITACFYNYGYDENSFLSPFLFISIMLLTCEIFASVIWVFLGEIFPMDMKDTSISVCLLVNFASNFALNEVFGHFDDQLMYPFLFFAAWGFLGVAYVQVRIPHIDSSMPMEEVQCRFLAFCTDSSSSTNNLESLVTVSTTFDPTFNEKSDVKDRPSGESDRLLFTDPQTPQMQMNAP